MATITKENARSRMKTKNIPVNIRVAFLSGALGNCCSEKNNQCDDECIENFIISYLNDETYRKSLDAILKEPEKKQQSKIMWPGPSRFCR